MKVALLGAPGSGKTKIARRLARRLNAELKSWRVVDSYVDNLTKRTGEPYGPDQTFWAYRYNLQVVSERWTLEDELSHKGFNSISCGSIFESIIYASAQSMVIPALSEQLMLEETHIARLMMSSFGALATRTFDYDALFYLPLTVDDEESWISVVNAKLPEVLEGLSKTAVSLTGTDRQKVDHAETIIHAISAAFTTDEQQTVRPGDVPSERDEPGSDSLSDVPPAQD